MKDPENPVITLAIESAISGGSLCLLRDSEVIGERTGDRGVSRAEDILVNIDELISETIRDKKKIQRIAISIGPGSFTGLRIGIATVMGLKRSLGIEYIGVPLLREMAESFESRGSGVAAIPMGKADICIQEFQDAVSVASPRTLAKSEFEDLMAASPAVTFILHGDLIEIVNVGPSASIVDAGRNMAAIIGLAAVRLPASEILAPIYVQNPRFA